MNAAMEIIVIKSIPLQFNTLYYAVKHPTKNYLLVYGKDTVFFEMKFDLDTYEYSRQYHNAPYYESNRYFSNSYDMAMYYDSTNFIIYLYRTDSMAQLVDRNLDCQFQTYTGAPIIANSVDVTIPSPTVVSITKGTLTMLSVLNSDSDRSINIADILSCPSFLVTEYFRSSSYPTELTYNSYSEVEVGGIFCTLIASSQLDVEVVDTSGNAVSWVQYNAITGKIEGSAPESGKTYEVYLHTKANEATFSYKLSLSINS